jgi:hypothetical protein
LAGAITIRPLTSGAPIRKQEGISVASLEKILVDLAVDKEFFPFQGNEVYNIFNSAFKHYTINHNTLLRYAARRGKREKIEEIIDTIKRL